VTVHDALGNTLCTSAVWPYAIFRYAAWHFALAKICGKTRADGQTDWDRIEENNGCPVVPANIYENTYITATTQHDVTKHRDN